MIERFDGEFIHTVSKSFLEVLNENNLVVLEMTPVSATVDVVQSQFFK